MKYELPVRNILKYSIVLSLVVSFISFMGGVVQERNWIPTLFRIATTFIIFLSFSLINLCLLKSFEKKTPVLSSQATINNKKHFVIGALITFIPFFLIHYLGYYLVENGYIIDSTFNIQIAHLGNWVYLLFLVISIILYSIIYILHNFIILDNWKNQVELENSRLKSINADTVNLLLKQQIQPHFLFNALNVLKTLIKRKPEVAEEYLISLSDFLRASVNQNRKSLATLKEELKICVDYMDMQKIRFGDAIDFKIEISPDELNDGGLLPVFSLQPLVENAIKHNNFTEESPLKIRVLKRDEWLEISNNSQPKINVIESSGVGLDNLEERYRILSGDPLQIQSDGAVFSVKIKILNESIEAVYENHYH